MARRKRTRRGRGGRFVKRAGRRVRRVRIRRHKVVRRRSRKSAVKKAWRTRLAHRGRVLKTTSIESHARHLRRRNPSRRHNPFAIMGRKGSFGLIPSLDVIKDGAVKGIGAAVSDVVRATGYSFIGRTPNQSIAEDLVARLASGWITGTLAGYVLGQKMANDIYEGNLTVAVYELVADAAAAATQGAPKLFGFVANPYAGRPVKAFLPTFAFGGAPALPAPASAETMAGLGGVVPEGSIVPIGAVVPEGDVLPLGDNNPRFSSRF